METITVGEYIYLKYDGLGRVVCVEEATVFGIVYPLVKGWYESLHSTLITKDMAERLIESLLEKKIRMDRKHVNQTKPLYVNTVKSIALLNEIYFQENNCF